MLDVPWLVRLQLVLRVAEAVALLAVAAGLLTRRPSRTLVVAGVGSGAAGVVSMLYALAQAQLVLQNSFQIAEAISEGDRSVWLETVRVVGVVALCVGVLQTNLPRRRAR